MNIQIGRVELEEDTDTFFYGDLHVQSVERFARKYDVPIYCIPRNWKEYPWEIYCKVDGFKFHECSKVERIDLID